MKLSLSTAIITGLACLEAACGACTPAPSPTPTYSDSSTGPESVPPAGIYLELTEAGCLSPDDSGEGLAGVAELENSDAEPAWLACLAAGGAVGDCETPCQ